MRTGTRSATRPTSLAEVSRRCLASELGPRPFSYWLREGLDEFYAHPDLRQAFVSEEPAPLGNPNDAYLGAVAEQLARHYDLPIPPWSEQPHRFLGRPLFMSQIEGMKPLLLAESPVAFRRRQIFTSANVLDRARKYASDHKGDGIAPGSGP